MAAASVLSFSSCNGEDPMAPANLEIHDSYAEISDADNEMAELVMEGVITNNLEQKIISYNDLPYLTIDGEKIETTYEPVDSED